jgi:hypothetical protein
LMGFLPYFALLHSLTRRDLLDCYGAARMRI